MLSKISVSRLSFKTLALVVIALSISLIYYSTNIRRHRAIPDWYSDAYSYYPGDSYFAICAVVKNEPDLAEWVEYHKRLGCGKFYIFDDNSSVPLFSSIEQYITSGLVDYQFANYSYYLRPQRMLYDFCLKNYGFRHKFIGMLDSDEFLVIVNSSQKIPDVLADYEEYGGLAVQWKLFGSSGHVNRPQGGVLKNYRNCSDNRHIKTIINTKYGKHMASTIHEAVYEVGRYTVLTNRTRIKGCYNDHPVYDVMYLNHYNVKSWEDFQGKVARGKANRNTPIQNPQAYFDAANKGTKDCGALQMPVE